MEGGRKPSSGTLAATARRTLVIVGIVALALGAWQIVDALILIFIGVLLAVFLRGLAHRVHTWTRLPVSGALGLVFVVLTAVFAAAGYFLGPRVAAEISQLLAALPDTVAELRQTVRSLPAGEYLIGWLQGPEGQLQLDGNIFSRLTGTASRLLSTLTNLLLILFAAVFFTVSPKLYVHGVTLLIPRAHERRVHETLEVAGSALWKWLMGKLIAMLFIGTFVSAGLFLIGMPVPVALGVISGLLDFVPFIGPTVAAVPGILLALTISPAKALYAALVYFVAQQIEGNILTPLIQQEQVSMPPVLVLFAVVAGGLLFGLLGAVIATPLVVVIMVFVKMLYVEDTLGKQVEVPGRER